MPRTAKAPTKLVKHAGVDSAGVGVYTTIDPALVTAGLSLTGAGDIASGKAFLHVKNTAGTPKDITIKAGTGKLAFMKSEGDLVVTVPNAGERIIGPLEDARFEQDDHTFSVDFAAGTTGSIAVFQLP